MVFYTIKTNLDPSIHFKPRHSYLYGKSILAVQKAWFNFFIVTIYIQFGGHYPVRLPWTSALINRAISGCDKSACHSHPCQNNGICMIDTQGSKSCLCYMGYSGSNCHNSKFMLHIY